jgi:signal transduction histidine kinase
MGQLNQKISELAQSRLVRRLVVGFMCVVLVDLTIMGIFAVETTKRESHLKREIQMIKASQRLSTMAKNLLEQRRFIDDTRFTATQHRSEHTLTVTRNKNQMKNLVREWKIAGLPTEDVEGLSRNVDEMCKTSSEIYLDNISDDKRESAYGAYMDSSTRLYIDAISRFKNIHGIINEETKIETSDPLALGLPAFLITALTWFMAAYLIFASLTLPITRLAGRCRNLMKGQIIPPPSSSGTEISRLELTFHEMSSVVAETEQSRTDFLRQMQTAQEVTLEHVGSLVDTLSASVSSVNSQARDTFALMKTNLQGMLFLLSSMTYGLNFSEDENLDLKPQKTSTTELLHDTSNTVTWLMKRKKIDLVIEDVGVELDCDLHLVERVIVNLLSNASKFSANGSKIQLTTEALTDGVRFSIRDFGCGISEENQAKLFQKFSQVESVDGVKRKGSGLGLMICKNIVEAHGGSIGCDSVENQGSCFWFTIPAKPKQQQVVATQATRLRTRRFEKVNRNLIITLATYLICQAGLLVNLFAKYQQLDITASEYARQKELLIGTQELMTLFLTWRQKSLDAVRATDINSLMELNPMMKQQLEQTEHLEALSKPGNQVHKELEKISEHLTALAGIAYSAMDKLDALSQQEGSAEFKVADAHSMVVEKSLFNILSIQRKTFDSSVLTEQASRGPIATTLLIATIINTLALIGLGLIAAYYISRVRELNAKALQFAFGNDLKQTIQGQDELAYLDEQLCDVAQRLRAAQRQRQDLMAIINHDLRTPLGAFLNGLEMVSAGMFGDLSDEDERTAHEAAKQVESVLAVIDDFLALEKAEHQQA